VDTVVALAFWQPCGLHMVGRTATMVLGRFDLTMPVYSLSRIFKMHKHRRNLKLALTAVIQEKFVYTELLPTQIVPVSVTNSAEFRALLTRLLLGSWQQYDRTRDVDDMTAQDRPG
jgi:hypothetical protein